MPSESVFKALFSLSIVSQCSKLEGNAQVLSSHADTINEVQSELFGISMRKFTIISLLVFLFASELIAGGTDIRMRSDLDPRETMRVVVLPATLPRSVRRVEPSTVANLLATELIREYDVLDLLRFEQIMMDRRFTLEDAFNTRALPVVQDTARLDAIVRLDIYRFDPGTPGFFIMAKSGRIGIQVRLVDPSSGQVFWSMNRLAKVKAGSEFLDAATSAFEDIVDDLSSQLQRRTRLLVRAEERALEEEMRLAEQERQRELEELRRQIEEAADDTTAVEENVSTIDSSPYEDADQLLMEEDTEIPILFMDDSVDTTSTSHGAAPEPESYEDTDEEELPVFHEDNETGPVDLPPFNASADTSSAETSPTSIELPPLDFESIDFESLPDIFGEEDEEDDEE